jgi:hypothetical protein
MCSRTFAEFVDRASPPWLWSCWRCPERRSPRSTPAGGACGWVRIPCFSIVIFPILISLGIGTWVRLVQLGMTDVLHVQAINRIRHYYLEVAPEAKPYFSYPHYDDADALRQTVLPVRIGFEGFGSAGFQVAIVNSVLLGAFAGILTGGLFDIGWSSVIVIGVLAIILGFGLQLGYSATIALRFSRGMEIRFPSQGEQPESA